MIEHPTQHRQTDTSVQTVDKVPPFSLVFKTYNSLSSAERAALERYEVVNLEDHDITISKDSFEQSGVSIETAQKAFFEALQKDAFVSFGLNGVFFPLAEMSQSKSTDVRVGIVFSQAVVTHNGAILIPHCIYEVLPLKVSAQVIQKIRTEDTTDISLPTQVIDETGKSITTLPQLRPIGIISQSSVKDKKTHKEVELGKYLQRKINSAVATQILAQV